MKAKNSQACVAEVQKAHKGLGQSLSELESGGQRPLTAHSKALLTTHLEHSPPLRTPTLLPDSESPFPTRLLSFLCHLALPPWISRPTSRTTAATAAERTSPTLKRSVKPEVKDSQQTLSLPTKKLAVSAQEALRRKRAPPGHARPLSLSLHRLHLALLSPKGPRPRASPPHQRRSGTHPCTACVRLPAQPRGHRQRRS